MSAPPTGADRDAARIPLPFLLAGVLFLAGGLVAFPFVAPRLVGDVHRPGLLAVVHAAALGFVLPVLVGASLQLLPVLTGAPLRRAARTPLLRAAGREPGLLGLALAFAGLLLDAAVGLSLVLDRNRLLLSDAPADLLAAHLHLGVLGAFTVAIFAVESRLLPMFLLAPVPPAHRVRAAFGLLSGGALLLTVTLALRRTLLPGAVAVVLAFAVQVWNLAAILFRRRRKEVDAGFLYLLSAHADLGAALLLGLAMALGAWAGRPLAGRLAAIYGFLLLVGWLLQAAVGVVSKILPFLVWQIAYAPGVGLGRVPTLKDLSSERLQLLGFVLFRTALLAFAAALVAGTPARLAAAAAFVSLSLVPFLVHAAQVASHLWNRRIFKARKAPFAVSR